MLEDIPEKLDIPSGNDPKAHFRIKKFVADKSVGESGTLLMILSSHARYIDPDNIGGFDRRAGYFLTACEEYVMNNGTNIDVVTVIPKAHVFRRMVDITRNHDNPVELIDGNVNMNPEYRYIAESYFALVKTLTSVAVSHGKKVYAVDFHGSRWSFVGYRYGNETTAQDLKNILEAASGISGFNLNYELKSSGKYSGEKQHQGRIINNSGGEYYMIEMPSKIRLNDSIRKLVSEYYARRIVEYFTEAEFSDYRDGRS